MTSKKRTCGLAFCSLQEDSLETTRVSSASLEGRPTEVRGSSPRFDWLPGKHGSRGSFGHHLPCPGDDTVTSKGMAVK